MREIRFRGKRIDNGEWVYGYMIGNDVIVGDIVEFTDEYFNTEFWYKVDPETVGQYTGLKDENDKDIYEGDILECFTSGHSVVKFYGGLFGLMNKVEGFVPFNQLHGHVKVIGNIYEHLHLLEREGDGANG